MMHMTLPRFWQHYRQLPLNNNPGSWEHWLTYVVGFAIVAKK